MNINDYTTRLFEHIKNLDYPRKSGSEGERKAAEYISSMFLKYGYEPIHEEFGYFFSHISRKILPIILYSSYLVLSLINLIYWDNFIVSIFTIIVPIVIIITLIRIDLLFKKMIKTNFKRISKYEQMKNSKRSIEKRINKCKNIIAEYNHANYEKHLYITCHYDSISLKLSRKSYMLIIFIGGLSFLGYFILYLIEFILTFFNLELFSALWFIYIILCVTSIIFLDMLLLIRAFRSNVSHGSIDDATGIAILLELSNIVRELKPKLKITFAAFSSEEIGFYGSCFHYYKNKDLFNSETQVISIDMIGEKPPLSYVKSINPIKKIKTNKNFNLELEKIAKDCKINMKGITFFYPGSDFAVWLLNGYKANWIYSKSRLIHSKKDNPSNVNKKLMAECFQIFVKYFEKFI